jgi:hypothetical protein
MLETKYPKVWQDDLVAAYLAASYQMQKQERVAESLIDRPAQLLEKRGQPFRYENYYDPLVRDAQTLYLLSRHFPQRAKALPPEAMLALMKPVADNQFNTLSAAYTILALDAYANAVGAKATGKLSIAEIDVAGKLDELALPDNLLPRVAFAPGTAKLKFGMDTNLTGYFAVTESGFDRSPPAGELRNGLEILREYVDAAGKPVTAVKIGDEVVVRLRFRALERDFLPNLALVDLLPGGFEPVLQSQALDAQSEAAAPGWINRLGRGGNWTAEYADIRDDRVVLYGTATRDVAEYSYRIKATNSGSFIVPPAYGESLYERSVQARSKAGSIVVEKAGK